jgi:hypothetical protein
MIDDSAVEALARSQVLGMLTKVLTCAEGLAGTRKNHGPHGRIGARSGRRLEQGHLQLDGQRVHRLGRFVVRVAAPESKP